MVNPIRLACTPTPDHERLCPNRLVILLLLQVWNIWDVGRRVSPAPCPAYLPQTLLVSLCSHYTLKDDCSRSCDHGWVFDVAVVCVQEVGVQTLTGHEGSVMALLATGDGGVLSLGLDGSIKVRELHYWGQAVGLGRKRRG